MIAARHLYVLLIPTLRLRMERLRPPVLKPGLKLGLEVSVWSI